MAESIRQIIRKESFGGLKYELQSGNLTRISTQDFTRLSADSETEVRGRDNRINQEGLSAPEKLYLDIGWGCNMGCVHCLSKSGLGCQDWIYLGQVESIARQSEEMGIFRVKLGGGEPGLHPQFWEVVDAFRSRQINVSTSTNGLLVAAHPEIAKIYKDKQVKVSVSLDGRPDTHVAIRQHAGAYEAAVKAIGILQEAGVRTSIGTTLFESNLDDVPHLIEKARDLGVDIKFKRGKPAGRAREGDIFIKAPTRKYIEMVELMNRYDFVRPEGIMDLRPSNGGNIDPEHYWCGAGTRTLHIDPIGNVSSCVFIGPETVSGNVGSDGIDKIWNEGQSFVQLRQLALEGLPGCRGCDRESVCSGECRAMAVAVTGDIKAVDPCCPKRFNLV